MVSSIKRCSYIGVNMVLCATCCFDLSQIPFFFLYLLQHDQLGLNSFLGDVCVLYAIGFKCNIRDGNITDSKVVNVITMWIIYMYVCFRWLVKKYSTLIAHCRRASNRCNSLYGVYGRWNSLLEAIELLCARSWRLKLPSLLQNWHPAGQQVHYLVN